MLGQIIEAIKITIQGLINQIATNISRFSSSKWTDGIVTPSDSVTYDISTISGLYIATGGILVIADSDGNILTTPPLAAGTILAGLRPTKIMAATNAGVVILKP